MEKGMEHEIVQYLLLGKLWCTSEPWSCGVFAIKSCSIGSSAGVGVRSFAMGLRLGVRFCLVQGFRGNGHLKQKWNATTLRVLVATTNTVVVYTAVEHRHCNWRQGSSQAFRMAMKHMNPYVECTLGLGFGVVL